MRGVLDDEAGVRLQLIVWQHAITGEILEYGARAAESTLPPHEWDKRAVDLETQLISLDGEGFERVPDWWALPWVAEHVVRGRVEYEMGR